MTSEVKDAETRRRGYLVTGEPSIRILIARTRGQTHPRLRRITHERLRSGHSYFCSPNAARPLHRRQPSRCQALLEAARAGRLRAERPPGHESRRIRGESPHPALRRRPGRLPDAHLVGHGGLGSAQASGQGPPFHHRDRDPGRRRSGRVHQEGSDRLCPERPPSQAAPGGRAGLGEKGGSRGAPARGSQPQAAGLHCGILRGRHRLESQGREYPQLEPGRGEDVWLLG